MSQFSAAEKKDELIVVSSMRSKSAIRYYRLEAPLRALESEKLAHTLLDDGGTNRERLMDAMFSSNIIVRWRPMGREDYEGLAHVMDLEPKLHEGKMIFPPLVVVDSDDAIDYVHPTNYVYNLLGIRNWDGELLKPGDEVVAMVNGEPLLIDGKKKVLWRDKEFRGQAEEFFDIERNLRNIGFHYDTCRKAAGVTVSTEPLADHYREQLCKFCAAHPEDKGCKHPDVDNVYVYPNSVIPEDYPTINLAPHEGVRILWEGGASHIDSWMPIRQPVLDVLANNPQAKLIIFGSYADWMQTDIKPEQREIHSWIDYSAYLLKHATLDADINLCPLVDQKFTRCKSAIRWYEGSLGPRPAATIAANVGPYKEIQDGVTGLLYDTPQDFAESLHLLINDADLRKRLGAAAKEWVIANRSARVTASGLADFYKQLLSKQRQKALMP